MKRTKLAEAERLIELMREALAEAQRTVDHTIGCTPTVCDAHCLLNKITAALAAAEGKGEIR